MGTQHRVSRHLTTSSLGFIKLFKMGKFDGKFVMESHQNLTPCMLALGMTEDMLKKMLDPKNVITMTVVENSDGSFTSGTTQSLAPEFNHSSTFKIGETTTVKEPWPCTVTVTKKSDTVWNTRTEMGGKVMIAETTGNNYGVSIRGTIEGTALSFSEEFRRVSPQVTGLYYLESEKNLEAIMKIMVPQMKCVLRKGLLARRKLTLASLMKNMTTRLPIGMLMTKELLPRQHLGVSPPYAAPRRMEKCPNG